MLWSCVLELEAKSHKMKAEGMEIVFTELLAAVEKRLPRANI